jgi:hypothetical protein
MKSSREKEQRFLTEIKSMNLVSNIVSSVLPWDPKQVSLISLLLKKLKHIWPRRKESKQILLNMPNSLKRKKKREQ